MKRFEFILSFTEPEPWMDKVIIEATDKNLAYYDAFCYFAIHIAMYDCKPEKIKITCKEL